MVEGLPAPWLTALLVFVAVALMMVSFSMLLEVARERRQRRQMMQQLEKLSSEGLAQVGAGPIFRGQSEEDLLRTIAVRLPHLQTAKSVLEQADIGWSLQRYVATVIGLTVGAGLATRIVTGSWLIAMVVATVAATLPYLYLRWARTRRMQRFEEQLPEAVDLLGRAIRAGHPISSGFKMVADEAAEPVAGEFRRVFEEQRFGLAFEESLLGMADRIPLVDVRIFVTAVLIQREVGGNLAEILDKLSAVIRERFNIQRQIRVYTAQGRLSGYVLGVLPFGIGLVLFALDADYMRLLFEEPLGKAMIVFGLTAQFFGYIWIRKIVRIEV